ncbi:MAG: radical SAM protein [Pseudomarimonas sp.]
MRARSIDLYLTTRCNLRCKTCYLGDHYFQEKSDMALETVREIGQWAILNDVSDITFLGGEPTLHPRFPRILEIIEEIGIRSRRIVTNGGSGFLKISSAALGRLTRVNVSVDGHDKHTHDAVRGSGSFANIEKSIARLKDAGIPFGLTCTPTQPSISRVLALVALAEAVNAMEINIHWPSPIGRLRDGTSTDLIGCEEWNEIVRAVERVSIRRSDFRIRIQIAHLDTPEIFDRVVCASQKQTNFQFFPDGRVLSCGMLADSLHLAGHSFSQGRLALNDEGSEVSLTKSAVGAVCPLRTSCVTSTGKTYQPACIYVRRVVTRDGLQWESA